MSPARTTTDRAAAFAMNISHWIERHADYAPSKVAIAFEGRDVTYGELAREIARLASGLVQELGVRRGDRVAILSYNRPEYLALIFACARIGAICVPLNWRLAPPEQLYILRHADVAALFCDEAFRGAIDGIGADLPAVRLVGFGFADRTWSSTRAAWVMAPPSRRGRSMTRR